jgi:hypothetical protein
LQIRKISAGDQKYKPGQPEREPHNASTNVVGYRTLQWFEAQALTRYHQLFICKVARKNGHRLLRLFYRHARLQPTKRLKVVVSAPSSLFGGKRQRCPDVQTSPKKRMLETAGHYSDYRCIFSAHSKNAAYDVLVSAEPAQEKAVA